MESVKTHYDDFLGSVYSWIIGDFDTAYRRNVAFFETLGLEPEPGAVALDLGCGPGCQSLPLAELGFDVLAIDFCQPLLAELKSRTAHASVRAVCADLLDFPAHLDGGADLIVCMGDTLVHLPDRQSVDTLLGRVCAALKPGGLFVYAIRDYVDAVPEGADRFIPVRSDEHRIFTCFLDYRDDVVHVHDLLHEKLDGDWRLRISDYLKLRLDSAEIDSLLEAGGLAIRQKRLEAGMITVVSQRPA